MYSTIYYASFHPFTSIVAAGLPFCQKLSNYANAINKKIVKETEF